MAKKTRPQEEEDEPSTSIEPLIDVAFLLLIYFIITSTLAKKEADLGIQLPTQSQATGDPPEIDSMKITLTEAGEVQVGDGGDKRTVDSDITSRKLPGLLDELQRYKRAADLSNSKTFVVVAANDGAKQQRFVDVVNCLAKVEISSVTMTGFTKD